MTKSVYRDNDRSKTFKVNLSKYKFLNTLASGIDPLTGKCLFTPDQSLRSTLQSISLFVLRYDNLESTSFRVTKDAEAISAEAKRISEQKKAKQIKNKNVGTRWTEKEDEQLKEEYLSNIPLSQIAQRHDRTLSAVERRILKLLPLDKIEK